MVISSSGLNHLILKSYIITPKKYRGKLYDIHKGSYAGNKGNTTKNCKGPIKKKNKERSEDTWC